MPPKKKNTLYKAPSAPQLARFGEEYLQPAPGPYSGPGGKRRRTSEDFLSFCTMVLDYENYKRDEPESSVKDSPPSPLGSTASSVDTAPHLKDEEETTTADDSGSDGGKENSNVNDAEAELITCYCNRPYSGRPMVACDACQTWVHIKCAGLARKKIPDVWYCRRCEHMAPAAPEGLNSESADKLGFGATSSSSSASATPSSEPKSKRRGSSTGKSRRRKRKSEVLLSSDNDFHSPVKAPSFGLGQGQGLVAAAVES